MMRYLLILFALFGHTVQATELEYRLEATSLAPGVFAVQGDTEHFSRRNGGNILNTGFIVTDSGVLVIDVGPSRLYGLALRALIHQHTDQPIAHILLTHLHPDHTFGLQAFEGIKVSALPGTIDGMRTLSEGFADALYHMLGDWMRGTEVRIPQHVLTSKTLTLGNRRIRLLPLRGHSGADLAVFDTQSEVLFAGDLVFLDRAPTTPQADIEQWLVSLENLEKLNAAIIVPGHGPIDRTRRSIRQTRHYLRWLDQTLARGARQGFDMNELMQARLPPELATLSVWPAEFHRSVAHLYPRYEAKVLRPVPTQ